MANGLSIDSRSAWAAHSSSSSLGTPASRPTGKVDAEASWERIREQACRALTSDPDIVFYISFLASNKAYKQASALAPQLDTLVLAAEGATFPTVDVEAYSGSAVPEMTTSPESLQIAVQALVQRASSAAPATKLGRRQGIRGEEAKATFLATIDAFLVEYAAVRSRARLLASLVSFSFAEYRKYALTTPLLRAESAISTDYSAATASSFVTQNAAAAAALTVLGREPSIRSRLKYDRRFLPEAVSLTLQGTSAVFSSGSPAYVFIRAGDKLKSSGGVSIVLSVTADGFTVDTPVEGDGPYYVEPGSFEDLSLLAEALDTFLENTPETSAELREQLTKLDTAADINSVLTKLADLQAKLCGVSGTTSSVLERRGLEAPASPTSLLSSLLAYAPSLPKATRDSALAILDILEKNGFAYAASSVLSGNLAVLLGTLQGNTPGAYVGVQPGDIGNV